VARFTDDAAGLTVQVHSSNKNGYRVRVTRTPFPTQGLPEQSVQGPVDGQAQDLAPPQAPFAAISFPFGVGWDLGPLAAD
jgi:hypothetical protein